MARKAVTTYTYIDDLTGEEVPEEDIVTVRFGWDGKPYTIDLSKANAKTLSDFLKPYVEKGKPYGDVRVPGARKAGTSRPGALQWAKDQGLVSPTHRGRLPKEVQEAFDKAH